MPGGLGDLASLPGRHGTIQDVLPQLGQPVPQIQRVSHQGARGSDAGLQAGAEFGGGELQHLRGAVPAQLASSFRAGQRSLGRRLAVGMVEIPPMRRQLQLLALQPQDQTAGPRHQRQCRRSVRGGRRIRPTWPLIEHKFILEPGSDIDPLSVSSRFRCKDVTMRLGTNARSARRGMPRRTRSTAVGYRLYRCHTMRCDGVDV
jgi:hypothetical protein